MVPGFQTELKGESEGRTSIRLSLLADYGYTVLS